MCVKAALAIRLPEKDCLPWEIIGHSGQGAKAQAECIYTQMAGFALVRSLHKLRPLHLFLLLLLQRPSSYSSDRICSWKTIADLNNPLPFKHKPLLSLMIDNLAFGHISRVDISRPFVYSKD